MRKWLSVMVLCAVVLTSCQPLQTQFTPSIGPITSSDDVVSWVMLHISYESDMQQFGEVDYWQTPWQTYTNRHGDCEDYTLLYMYLMDYELGIKPDFVELENKATGEGHAIALLPDGAYVDPQFGTEPDNWRDTWSVYTTLTYDVAMWRAATFHRVMVDGT